MPPRRSGCSRWPECAPDLACGRCERGLTVRKHKNYFYECAPCGLSFALYTLIPIWSERFAHNGYYLDSDGESTGRGR